jgi:hypothetical protein
MDIGGFFSWQTCHHISLGVQEKPNVIGDGVRYKTWLVTHGFEQCPSLDYIETFVLVIEWETICTIVTIATHNGWCIEQLDVQITFLNDFLNEKGFIVPI